MVPGAGLRVGVLDPTELAHAHRHAPHVCHHDVAELVEGIDPPDRADPQLVGPAGDPSPRDLDVLALDGLLHVVDGEVVGEELVGVEEDADLALARSGEGDLAHPVHGLEHALDLLVRDLRGLAQAALACHHHPDHGIGVGVGLLDHRGQDVGGQLAQGARDLLTHVLGRVLDVAFEHELRGDAGVALGGARGQLVEPGERAQGFLDGQHDLGGHFLGGGAGKPQGDVDGGGIGAGEKVDPEVAEGEDAEDHQEAHQHHREDGTPDAKGGEAHDCFTGSTGAPSRSSWPSGAIATVSFSVRPSRISTSPPLRSPSFTSCS